MPETVSDSTLNTVPDGVSHCFYCFLTLYHCLDCRLTLFQTGKRCSIYRFGHLCLPFLAGLWNLDCAAPNTHCVQLSRTCCSRLQTRVAGVGIDAQNGKSITVSPSGTVADGNLNSDTVSENNRNSAKHHLEQCSVYCLTPFRATMRPRLA